MAATVLSSNFNVSAPGANTNILAEGVVPSRHDGVMRVTVQVATGSVLNVMVTQGATTKACGLNGNVALTAGCLYTFSFAVRANRTYNFQVETNVALDVLDVEEVWGSVL